MSTLLWEYRLASELLLGDIMLNVIFGMDFGIWPTIEEFGYLLFKN